MRKKHITISVITPTYNRGWCIERAIKSILKQGYPNWELLIVDDGSNDNTQEIVEKFKDNRIKYYKLKINKGVNFARNVGLEQCSGDLITFLDSDDELVPEALNTCISDFNKIKDPKIFNITYNCMTPKKEIIGKMSSKKTRITYRNYIQGLKFSGEKWGVSKASILKQYRFPKLRGQNEGLLWLQIMKKYDVLMIPKALRVYHTENQNRLTGTGQMVKKAKYQQAVYRQFLKRFKKDYLKYNPRGLSKIYLEKGLNEIIAKKNKDGRDSIINSIKYNRSKLPLVFTLYILSFLPNRLFIKLAKFGHKFKKILK